jgi:hypothetical protein
MSLALIGDIHGFRAHHYNTAKVHDQTIQLGDCGGFDGVTYSYLDKLDPENHKVLGGNHDNYDDIINYPHYLGDYGIWNDIFFIRGAYSVDKASRLIGKTWWEQEEIPYSKFDEICKAFENARPKVVISHDCPLRINYYLYGGGAMCSRTVQLLDYCFELYQPEEWYFGHHHRTWEHKIMSTNFRCLDIDEVLVIRK